MQASRLTLIPAALCACAALAFAQVDPGPRPGSPGTSGAPLPNLTLPQFNFWDSGRILFRTTASVSGTIAGEPAIGLGPGYNGNSCFICHSQPAEGGTSPGLNSPQNPIQNPQIGLATVDGATNTVPSFIFATGPVREARFLKNPDGTPDGGVHDLYTIKGRSDAGGCGLLQPDFATQVANHNVGLRIPTPTFGVGFVENTPESALKSNLALFSAIKTRLGISGHLNTNGNDGTTTRFGWKAQNKSLLIFSGEALNVEMGVTNDNFPNERFDNPGCVFNPTPEDSTNIVLPGGGTTGTAGQITSRMENFLAFMRLNAAPTPVPFSASAANGQRLFGVPIPDASGNPIAGGPVGCVLCHSNQLTTAASIFTDLNNATYQPLSDFAVHNMGATLADGVTQGNAGPSDFRTAPLWGVGQRLFFLHDGRTTDLLQAIRLHSTLPVPPATSCSSTASGCSEANGVIALFNALSPTQQQDILNFLRSL